MLHILIYNLLAKISLDLTASLILITRHTFAITIRLLGPKIVPGICKLKYQVLNHLDHALRNIHKYKIEELYTINFQEQLSQISLFFPSKKRYTKPPNMPSSFLQQPPSLESISAHMQRMDLCMQHLADQQAANHRGQVQLNDICYQYTLHKQRQDPNPYPWPTPE